MALLLVLLCARAAPAADMATQIREASRHAVSVYQTTGLAGLTDASQACYRINQSDFQCLHFDLAAAALDRRFATAMGIGRYPYFDAAQVLQRARVVFAHARWNQQTSNQYLQFAQNAVDSAIMQP